ncbi:protein FAM8A1 [Bombyx mandarina]|uniref:Protein FAM8A1 n=1 Tax=Bombyx mandarina TaxID=7092 RepID=A0A6J2JKU4_BOMMA|nr:protein FAM8A1 [Bombyx mandarina]
MLETERLIDNSAEPTTSAEQSSTETASAEREAYFQALRIWIQQAQLYQNLTCFPYYMVTFQGLQNHPTNVPLLNNNYQFQGQQFPFQVPNAPRIVPEAAQQVASLTPAEVIARHGGYEYIIPPLHKRLIAEFIDFLLLFVLKLLVTFVAVDTLEIIDTEKFDFQKFSEYYDDYKSAIEFTSGILFLEIVYRLLVCLFEAICLCGNVGQIGGATPGKALLGLRVVTASAILPVEGRPKETVVLYPGRPLGFPLALLRSLLKNFLISLLFPLCVVMFVFKHNRTGYDIVCGVIVVEENMFPPRRNAA